MKTNGIAGKETQPIGGGQLIHGTLAFFQVAQSEVFTKFAAFDVLFCSQREGITWKSIEEGALILAEYPSLSFHYVNNAFT